MAQGIITDEFINGLLSEAPARINLSGGINNNTSTTRPSAMGVRFGFDPKASKSAMGVSLPAFTYSTPKPAPQPISQFTPEELSAMKTRRGISTTPENISMKPEITAKQQPMPIKAGLTNNVSPYVADQDIITPQNTSEPKGIAEQPSPEFSGMTPNGSYGIFGNKTAPDLDPTGQLARARMEAEHEDYMGKIGLDNAISAAKNSVLNYNPKMVEFLEQQKYGAKGGEGLKDVQGREAQSLVRYGMEQKMEADRATQQATQQYRFAELQNKARELAQKDKVDWAKIGVDQQKVYLDAANTQAQKAQKADENLWKRYEVNEDGNPRPKRTIFNIMQSGEQPNDKNLINQVNDMRKQFEVFRNSITGGKKTDAAGEKKITDLFMENYT